MRSRTGWDADVLVVYIPAEVLNANNYGQLGPMLSLVPGCVRIWCPGLSLGSAPEDHPLIPRLKSESDADALADLAHQMLLGAREAKPLVNTLRNHMA